MHNLHILSFAAAMILSSCGTAKVEPTSAVKDISAENLWAGQVTYTISRVGSEGCADQDDAAAGDIGYGSWARQRATTTALCFEVWMPGVTDQENPDFWRLLDVQAHYRYEGQGEYKTLAVASDKRIGNNRRYVINLRSFDPFPIATAPSDIPYRVLSSYTTESGRLSGEVQSGLSIYFTVNGKELKKPDGWPFYVDYTGIVYLPGE